MNPTTNRYSISIILEPLRTEFGTSGISIKLPFQDLVLSAETSGPLTVATAFESNTFRSLAWYVIS